MFLNGYDTPGILLGESYNGICTLADLFVIVKIPNKLSSGVAGEHSYILFRT
jgi:hypothetical protein